MIEATPIPSPLPTSLPPGHKPFTPAEAHAKCAGDMYLSLAISYREANDVPNAVACCLEGLTLTYGIARPLMVRDQLNDLMSLLDPTGAVKLRIPTSTSAAARTAPQCCTAPRSQPHTTRGPQYLERLVSVHQLLDYPSEYRDFNRAYEEAKGCLNRLHHVRELYIVQFRATSGIDYTHDDLCFSFVPAALISATGPYYLTDLCAVVRK